MQQQRHECIPATAHYYQSFASSSYVHVVLDSHICFCGCECSIRPFLQLQFIFSCFPFLRVLLPLLVITLSFELVGRDYPVDTGLTTAYARFIQGTGLSKGIIDVNSTCNSSCSRYQVLQPLTLRTYYGRTLPTTSSSFSTQSITSTTALYKHIFPRNSSCCTQQAPTKMLSRPSSPESAARLPHKLACFAEKTSRSLVSFTSS